MITNKLLLSVSVIAILVLSTMFTAVPVVRTANGQPLSGPLPSGDKAGANWEYINHDSWATNFNPQNEINKDNVRLLELKWMFPYPSANTYAGQQRGVAVAEGTIVPALVVDGIAYAATNMRNIYALNLETGRTVWTYVYGVDGGEAQKRLPVRGLGGHLHGINYFNGLIIMTGVECSVIAIDALTGKLAWEIKDTCLDVPGNFYDWSKTDTPYKGPGLYGQGSHPPVFYKQGNIFIWAMNGPDITGGGRTFIAGYDISTKPPKLVWRTFLQPPAEGDPEWALRECDKGWFFSYKAWEKEGILGIPCKEIPRQNLINDWGVPKHFTSEVTAMWGQWSVDDETGLVYIGTGNQGNMWNVTYTPGPNLYASSIMALDARSGRMVWWFQVNPHDMIEWDNSWNTVLARTRIEGQERKVIIKWMKLGLGVVLDAATGKPLRIWDPYKDLFNGARTEFSKPVDPRSLQDMRRPWVNYPSTDRFRLYPRFVGEMDSAWDGKTFYFATGGLDGWHRPALWDPNTRAYRYSLTDIGPTPGFKQNTTLFAWDIAANKPKWSFFIDGAGIRGGVLVSGGVVYLNHPNGNIYMLDAETGKLLDVRPFAVALSSQATMGKTVGGKTRLLISASGTHVISAQFAAGGPVPGALIVLGLPEKLPEPQVITKETIKETSKEVLKAALKELPKDVLQEVAPTQETISPISYAIVGIGVIMLVVAGVLFTRRKKA